MTVPPECRPATDKPPESTGFSDFVQPKTTGRVRWQVPAEHAGRRLDNLLLTRLKIPRAALYRLIRLGAIRVNGNRVAPGHRLVQKDELLLPSLRQVDRTGAGTRPSRVRREDFRKRLLGRGEGFLVVNKSAGLAVQGGTAVRLSLVELARAAFPEYPSVELVHRLDRDTSGCLVFATSLSFAQHFQRQMQQGLVKKQYLCLVRGKWDAAKVSMEGFLESEKASTFRDKKRPAKKRWARTGVRPLDYLDGATLMEAQPLTGRTHQLRIQFAHAGAPIAGDRRYGDGRFNRRLAQRGLRRMFLHASSIEFVDQGGVKRSFEAELEPDLASLLTPGKKAGKIHTANDGITRQPDLR